MVSKEFIKAHRIVCKTQDCKSDQFYKKGITPKYKMPKLQCKLCGANFSLPTKSSEAVRFYRVRAIQLYLEGFSLEDIGTWFEEDVSYIYFLIGGTKESVDYLNNIRLRKDSILTTDKGRIASRINSHLNTDRSFIVLDGVNTGGSETIHMPYPQSRFLKLEKRVFNKKDLEDF